MTPLCITGLRDLESSGHQYNDALRLNRTLYCMPYKRNNTLLYIYLGRFCLRWSLLLYSIWKSPYQSGCPAGQILDLQIYPPGPCLGSITLGPLQVLHVEVSIVALH